jgi:hypothetical protein
MTFVAYEIISVLFESVSLTCVFKSLSVFWHRLCISIILIRYLDRMKAIIYGLFAIPTLFSNPASNFDAPGEAFYIEPEKIHPKALHGVLGVMTITFAELSYHIHFNPPVAEIQGYERREDLADTASLVISLKNIKPLSGINYQQMIVRRFPVIAVDGSYCEIVYDLQNNLTIWVQTEKESYVRTSVGQLMPMDVTWFSDNSNASFTPELFYLMNGKSRKFYESPSDTAKFYEVHEHDQLHDIPFRTVKETIAAIEITEIANGFAKVSTRSGADGELRFTGWIRIFENNLLTIWPIEGSSC